MKKELLYTLLGRPEHRAHAKRARARGVRATASIREACSRYKPPAWAHEDSPTFILSAGWRSGSTLLQRLVCSNPEQRTLIWGEPYDLSNIVQRMSESLAPMGPEWPPEDYFFDPQQSAELTNQWIANLYPGVDNLWLAHRRFFDELFAKPAERHGYGRWGIKEVRLRGHHAHYLRWLYPSASFLFICRDPVRAYASYAKRNTVWFDRWPDRPMLTARQFALHWRELVDDFLSTDLDESSLLIRYEDLTGDRFDARPVERLLGHSIDPGVLDERIGGTDGQRVLWVSRLNRLLIKQATGRTRHQLGYAD